MWAVPWWRQMNTCQFSVIYAVELWQRHVLCHNSLMCPLCLLPVLTTKAAFIIFDFNMVMESWLIHIPFHWRSVWPRKAIFASVQVCCVSVYIWGYIRKFLEGLRCFLGCAVSSWSAWLQVLAPLPVLAFCECTPWEASGASSGTGDPATLWETWMSSWLLTLAWLSLLHCRHLGDLRVSLPFK